MPLRTSSGSWSETVLPSSTFPIRVIAPVVKSMASSSEVLPAPPWPRRRTLRMLDGSYVFIVSFRSGSGTGVSRDSRVNRGGVLGPLWATTRGSRGPRRSVAMDRREGHPDPVLPDGHPSRPGVLRDRERFRLVGAGDDAIDGAIVRIFSVSGSTRYTTPAMLSDTQTAPPASATPLASVPTGMVLATRFAPESISSRLPPALTTHTPS